MLRLKTTGQIVYPMPEERGHKPPQGYVDVLVPLGPRPGRSSRKPLRQASIFRVRSSKLENVRKPLAANTDS